jgi:hypothetical protein
MVNINFLNHALLTKWFWKLETEKGIWKTIIKNMLKERVSLSLASSINQAILSVGLACWKWKNNFIPIAWKLLGTEETPEFGKIGGWEMGFWNLVTRHLYNIFTNKK